MKKEKLRKIGAIVLLLGILVPVAVTAEMQTHTQKPETLSLVSERSEIPETNFADKLSEASTVYAYNMKGSWGIYETLYRGNFKALKRGNEIFGSIRYLLKDFVFYISLDSDDTFSGLVSFEGVQDISGEYLYNDGKFVALWDMSDYEGWFAGNL